MENFINELNKLMAITKPCFCSIYIWKDIGLLVRRSIFDLLFLVKHVLLLIIFYPKHVQFYQFYSGQC